MRSSKRRFKGKYDLFTIYLVPGATILLASLDSWTRTNLSVLGSAQGNKLLFAIWGFTVGIYYSAYILYLFNIGRYRNRLGKRLVYTAAGFLFMAVMIPYVPEQYPFKSVLHVLLAFFSPILLTIGIIDFLRFLSRKNRPHYRKAWNIMWILAFFSVFLLLEAGFITSFLEIFLVIGLCGYLRYMERLLLEHA